uniref:Uncharacterized protein n=1 Tax=Tanacetum cinerariifolium TaxID=118510 RepID=A0A699Q1V4_TANCI|nr:hypothetical protein [Tanacetum cinerariifolium]
MNSKNRTPLPLVAAPPLLLWGSVVGDKRGEWQLVGLWWSTVGRWWRGAAAAGGVIGGSSGGVVVAAVGVEWQRRWVVVDLGSGGAWGMRSDISKGREQFWVCRKCSSENFFGGGDVVASGGCRLAGGWAG